MTGSKLWATLCRLSLAQHLLHLFPCPASMKLQNDTQAACHKLDRGFYTPKRLPSQPNGYQTHSDIARHIVVLWSWILGQHAFKAICVGNLHVVPVIAGRRERLRFHQHLRKLEKAVAVRNSLREGLSGKFREHFATPRHQNFASEQKKIWI